MAVLGICSMVAGCGTGVQTFATDVPTEYHRFLTEKYQGRTVWTRRTLSDEKKNIKIEQDQEVKLVELGLQRSGSVSIISSRGRKRIVFPFHLDRPLSLEEYEKTFLDIFWLDPPDVRYTQHKKKYGTRIADAIRDHKIFKNMPPKAAYLSWGAPTSIEVVKRGRDETWTYETLNLKKAKLTFRASKVAHIVGDNISDTEASLKKRRVRRSSNE